MKSKYKPKLKTKLKADKKTFTWFWEEYIENKCNIQYSVFMNQLDGRLKLQPEVEGILKGFLST